MGSHSPTDLRCFFSATPEIDGETASFRFPFRMAKRGATGVLVLFEKPRLDRGPRLATEAMLLLFALCEHKAEVSV